jgi:hypothetical protein
MPAKLKMRWLRDAARVARVRWGEQLSRCSTWFKRLRASITIGISATQVNSPIPIFVSLMTSIH